jgi:peroxin-16
VSQERQEAPSSQLLGLLRLLKEIVGNLLSGVVFNSEILHIIRPFVYVLLTVQYGKRSWVPFQISLAIDFLTIFLVFLKLVGAQKLRTIEKRDLYWRCICSLMKYLLRDPLFEVFTIKLLQRIFQMLRLPTAMFGLLLSILNYYRYYIYIA